MEVEITFEPSGRNGIVAVGSYLSDAAKRLGVEIIDETSGEGAYPAEVVRIKKGRELLSEPTKIELSHLTSERREQGDRLAGQTKIEKNGELVVMVAKKKDAEEKEEKDKVEEFKKEFAEMPLEKKVANLLEMEAVTLSETISFVVNSPFAIFEKVIDVMAEFGLKLEREAKNAQRPSEHKSEAEPEKNGQKKTADKTTKNAGKKSAATKPTVKPESKNTAKAKKAANSTKTAEKEGEEASKQK